MKRIKSLSKLLKDKAFFNKCVSDDENLHDLQLQMLRIQQAVFHRKDRVIIIFEGFDAAGKGGTIRKLTEGLDPRSVRVHPIGPPTDIEQGTHWLYRFWTNLPAPGNIVVFDRSWYGRVLIEKVENLTSKKQIDIAHEEINQFEKFLQRDGIKLIKIFLAITKDEQYKRFQDRLNDPYKQWKLTIDDINARKKWNKYVTAVDEILKINNPSSSPWLVVAADSKKFTRKKVLQLITHQLRDCSEWMEKKANQYETKDLAKLLKR